MVFLCPGPLVAQETLELRLRKGPLFCVASIKGAPKRSPQGLRSSWKIGSENLFSDYRRPTTRR